MRWNETENYAEVPPKRNDVAKNKAKQRKQHKCNTATK
jgi:hypothetical protein